MNHEKSLTHLDLFSGIGGFALAADRVWPGIEHIFCDNEPFAQEVLEKHWPDSPIFSDIRNLTADAYYDGRAGGSSEINPANSDEQAQRRAARRAQSSDVFLLTGGFPCQPFSQAGRRKGEADDRFLWPEMCRVIGEFKPEWVIAENVRGLLTQGGGVVFERVCTDLEALGYEVQPIVIPAVAVGAPHRRDRVWFIAHSIDEGRIGRGSNGATNRERLEKSEQAGEVARSAAARRWEDPWLEVATRLCRVFNGLSSGLDKTMSDGIYSQYASTLNPISGQALPCLWSLIQSEAFQWSAGRFDAVQNKDYLFTVLWQHAHRTDGQNDLPFESAEVQEAYVRNVWHTDEAGCPPQGWKYNEQYAEEHHDALSSMSHEVALVAKEVWQAYLKDRNPRLKALGNAIVPQVAEEIMRAICNSAS